MLDLDRIRGIIPPVATPLTPEEKLDEPALRRQIRRLLDAGCHGMFMLGGTGEGIYLTDAVQEGVVAVTADEVAGRVPVIACVSDVSPARAILRGQRARDLGADALVSTAPYQRPMRPAEVYDFYVRLAEGTGMPTMLYNVPQVVQTNITPETIARLAEHEGIVGMKDSAGFAHLTSVAIHTRGTTFRLLCGTEFDFVPAMMIGAVGGTLAVANIWPELMVEAYDVCVAGEWHRGGQIQEKVSRFSGPAFQMPWLALCKYSLSLLGICGETCARPTIPLTNDQKARVRAWLAGYNLV